MRRDVFVYLAVRDVGQSKNFFGKLGFEFHAKFTDGSTACMIVNDGASVMLVGEPVFRTLTRREPCDTVRLTEALLAVTCPTREAVDELVKRAIAAGGRPAREPRDQGFLYTWSFHDLDGHQWDAVWMDPASAP